ncbi:small ribosomal subunit protein mS78 (rPPR3a) [Elaeis guineensis]|uniref:small ribosomal subunit protein mS78 (rPPR3a) n=1 Tax=Elaeis guineensis var. tenera TaxID=51953 RepID=UPI003C6D5200
MKENHLASSDSCNSSPFSSSRNPNPNPYLKRLKTTTNYFLRERKRGKPVASFKKSSESYYGFRCKHLYMRSPSATRCPNAVEAIFEEQKRYPAGIAREGFDVRLISLYGKAGMLGDAANGGTPRASMRS